MRQTRDRYLLRLLILAPPILLAIGGVVQVMRSPFDFGSTKATAFSSVPAWVISVDSLLLSVPFVVAGVWAASIVWRNSSRRFRLDVFQASLGLLGVVPNAIILLLYRSGLESSYSYRMIFGDGVGPVGSLVVTLLAATIWGGFVAALLALYANGVVPDGSGKYDRQADEPDAVGSLIKDMNRG